MRKKSNQAHTANTSSKGQGDWHVSNTSMGMGDYYGTGVKAKVGSVKRGMGQVPVSPKKVKTPPRSLA